MSKKYILNKETSRIELHFEKADYLELTEEQKREIKSAFLFSGKLGAWVSRSTKDHYRAIKICESLGFTKGDPIGGRLSYAEQLGVKAEKAEARAERYEQYSTNATKRAKDLQAEFNEHRKDWSWLTQPIISGHSGSQAFGRHKDKVMARFEKGFEEYQKSEYYQSRAAKARAAADNSKLKDRVYLHNRIKECNSAIKKSQSYISDCEKSINRIRNGETVKSWKGEVLTEDHFENTIEDRLEKYEYEQDKLHFFKKCFNDIGGNEFTKDNIKVGYIVNVDRSGKCEVMSAGPVNITYKVLEGGAAGFVLTAPYAAIAKVVEAKEVKDTITNPYITGDILCRYNAAGSYIVKAYQVVKTTPKGVRLQEVEVKGGEPVKDSFVSVKEIQKQVVKSAYSDSVGVYVDDWQLYPYTTKTA